MIKSRLHSRGRKRGGTRNWKKVRCVVKSSQVKSSRDTGTVRVRLIYPIDETRQEEKSKAGGKHTEDERHQS